MCKGSVHDLKIIVKYILKNLAENKTRTLLIIFSVAMCAALFFATLGLSSTAEKVVVDKALQLSGTADLVVSPKNQVGVDPFISYSALEKFTADMEYSIGTVQSTILYTADDDSSSCYINVIGITLDELALYNPLEFQDPNSAPKELNDNEIILGNDFCKENNLKMGDTITVKVSGKIVEVKLVGIAAKKGLFISETNGTAAIMSRSFIQELLETEEKCNVYYIKAKDGSLQGINDLFQRIENSCDTLDVEFALNQTEISLMVSNTTMPFYISLIFVVIMSVFIVYSAFSLIFIERMSAIGTLRSIGATKLRVFFANIIESIFIGLCGGILGCLMGIGVLNVIVEKFVTELSEGASVPAVYSVPQILITVAVALLLTTTSTFIPMIKVVRLPVKSIIFNHADGRKARPLAFDIVVLVVSVAVCIAAVIFASSLSVSFWNMIIQISCMVVCLLIAVVATPSLVRIMGMLFSGGGWQGVAGWLAVKNISDSKKLMNTVKLILISITCVLLISGMTNSISNTMTNQHQDYFNYDIIMQHRNADTETLNEINKISGVKESLGFYMDIGTFSPTRDSYFNVVYGIEDTSFFDYAYTDLSEANKEAINALGEGRNAILTNIIAGQLQLGIGDNIELELNDTVYTYKIIGIIDMSLNVGNMAIVDAEQLAKDADLENYSQIYIRCKDGFEIETVQKNIKSEFGEDVFYLETVSDVMKDNFDYVMKVFNILNAYAYLAIVIGIIGVVNNIIASFLERKKEFAIYRSVGMQRKTLVSMLISETFLIALFSVFIAAVVSFALLEITPSMMMLLFGRIYIDYSPMVYVGIFVGVVICSLLIAIIPVTSSAKQNIIDALKYE